MDENSNINIENDRENSKSRIFKKSCDTLLKNKKEKYKKYLNFFLKIKPKSHFLYVLISFPGAYMGVIDVLS